METAPEALPGGCAHDACLCDVGAGARFCSLACARAAAGKLDADMCPCGHFGCTAHQAF
jgi:hypothetical protein